MRITGLIFGGLAVFLVPVAIVYGFMTGFEEGTLQACDTFSASEL